MNVHVRWMIRRDMAEIIDIEQASFEFPWSEAVLIKTLKNKNCIGMVADDDDRVVGYMIYELSKTKLHVLNFAVAPTCRRIGIGRRMADKLAGKINPSGRSRITMEIRESNVAAQLFWRAMGYRCVNTLRDFYDDTTEDAYVFQFRAVAPSRQPTPSRISSNRVDSDS